MPSDLFAFAGNGWLYILIFKTNVVAPALGSALISLYHSAEENIPKFTEQCLSQSFSSKHAIKVFVILVPLTVVFEGSFYDVFLLLIYISIQCILKAFSSSESQWTSPECAASLDDDCEPSGSVWPCTHSSVPQWRADPWQSFMMWPVHRNERRVFSFPSQYREYNRAIAVGSHCFPDHELCVGPGQAWQSCALTGDVGPQLLPKGCTHLLLGSQPLHVPWSDPPTDDGQSGWLLQLP